MGKGKFLADLKQKCKEHDITLYLPKTKSVNFSKGEFVSGYFGGFPVKIACAMGRARALEVLVHESCHLDQWLENRKEFDQCNSDLVWDWIAGKRVRGVKKQINALRKIEKDCERRAIEKIKKYNLPIDIEKYTQRANAYLWFYTYMEMTRFWVWHPDKTPMVRKDIWSRMSTKLAKDHTRMPKRIERLFKTKYNYVKH